MPVNNEKYFYINRVGLARGSWALEKFEQDAQRHHMEDVPGKLAALRLTEYYELLERLQQSQGLLGGGAVVQREGLMIQEQKTDKLPVVRASLSVPVPVPDQGQERELEEDEGIDLLDDALLDDVENQWD